MAVLRTGNCMFNNKIADNLRSLLCDLSMLGHIDSAEGWEELRTRADALTEAFTAEIEFSLADATSRAAELFRQLAFGNINNTDEAFAHIKSLIELATAALDAEDIDHGALKEAVASTDAYLQDISSAQEEAPGGAPAIDEEFLSELEGRIDRLEKTLFQTRDGENDLEKVKAIFREYHTLKGEAGILGLKKLSEFWHSLESAIEEARHGKMTITRPITDALLELTKYGRRLLRDGKLSESDRGAVQTQLDRLLKAVGKTGAQVAPPPAQAEAVDFRTPAAKPAPAQATTPAPAAVSRKDNSRKTPKSTPAGNVPPVVAPPVKEAAPPPVKVTPAPVDQVGVAASAEPVGGTSAKKMADYVREVEQAGEGGAAATPVAGAEEPVPQEKSLRWVQIEVSKLDKLLDLVGEVSLVGSHLARGGGAFAEDKDASAGLLDLQRLCRSLHDMAAGLRMISIAPLFQRVQRAALEAGRAVNKRVEFEISGEDTRVDRIVIDKLSAALVHMARNSVDHGIESQEARRDIGKPAHGCITLAARRAGADVIIEFSDDGRGLDVERIIAKARKTGMIGVDEKLTPEQGANLIFAQGLSTSESVTGLSGRGVGMAVVRESAEALRGRVEIENFPGKGVTFRVRFPVALAAVETLLVRLGDNTLALPVQSVRETFRINRQQLSSVEGKGKIVTLRGIVVPMICLSGHLGLVSRTSDDPEQGVLILVEEGEKLCAILVDEVLETRQVVIRPLEGRLREIPDITGAALLSDRQVALVLDMRRLVDTTHICAGSSFSAASVLQAGSERQVETVSVGSNSVGLIDFSLKTRKQDGSVKTHVFAINAFKTREFVPVTPLTPVPDMPKGFAGMLLLRQETIPVMALDVLLGFAPAQGRNPEFDEIIIICEFSGVTVGFLVSDVNSVSYVTWDDIRQPPDAGKSFNINYVIGTIQLDRLRENIKPEEREAIAFLLDFERIVQQVLDLYGDIGAELTEIQLRKEHNRVLLVEDSPLIRRETAEVLRKAGLEVIEASNGKEAISIVDRLYNQARDEKRSIFNYLDLILSDIEMPLLDGYSLTRHIKSHPDLRLLPTLLHSSLTNETIVRRAREVHADGFVPKCDPHKLAEHLRKYL